MSPWQECEAGVGVGGEAAIIFGGVDLPLEEELAYTERSLSAVAYTECPLAAVAYEECSTPAVGVSAGGITYYGLMILPDPGGAGVQWQEKEAL